MIDANTWSRTTGVKDVSLGSLRKPFCTIGATPAQCAEQHAADAHASPATPCGRQQSSICTIASAKTAVDGPTEMGSSAICETDARVCSAILASAKPPSGSTASASAAKMLNMVLPKRIDSTPACRPARNTSHYLDIIAARSIP